MIAEVIVNVQARTITKHFSYTIPPELAYIEPGWRVVVPFGGRKVEGFVMEVTDGDETGLKAIAEVLDDSVWFDSQMIETARWISQYYLCTPADALRLFIPGKTGVISRYLYHANPIAESEEAGKRLAGRPAIEGELYRYLVEKNHQTEKGLVKVFGSSAAVALRSLIRSGLVVAEPSAATAKRPRFVKYLDLAVPKEALAVLDKNFERRPAQQRLIRLLAEKPSISLSEIKEARISSDTVSRLTDAGIVRIRDQQVLRDSYAAPGEKANSITLTEEQQTALDAIHEALAGGKDQTFLLHGITGSGKTEIYIKATITAREQGRQAIILVPEIALTNQIVSRFKACFGNDVVVIHSKLSVAERFDAWQRLQTGQAGIAIGARSAVFAPFTNLGLIIMDEEHEFTYKQEETPRYHTRQVAIKRAQLAGAAVILGSATPSLESYYQAKHGHYRLLTLKSRADDACLPKVITVDMREELVQGRRSVLSQPLYELLEATLSKKEQAIIVLNRRGYATFVLCRECGYVVKCSHCSVSMVYHAYGNNLRCHYCQVSQATPDVCPVCESRYIRYFGTGTQKIEEELAKLFPQARIVRMDQDTTGGKMDSHHIIGDFAAHKFDILLGTQMVAKGHDVKNVTAVGILAADSALNLPDFRAAERTFNLVTQAAGRAGRGNQPGEVVVQTYNPDHYAIVNGAAQDYEAFYGSEIPFRAQLGYPPFRELMKITIQNSSEVHLQSEAAELASTLRQMAVPLGNIDIFGPMPAAVAKIKDMHRMMIFIKAKNMTPLKEAISAAHLNHKPNVTFDVDPLNLL